ncbi:methyltransferase [Nocardia panacis]|uniref:methyltransferase n=1 Tax=Nocardia panacis TaxID=2340916 RepID=UPI001315458E|nr:methyltransferase [Nocardia panacis]
MVDAQRRMTEILNGAVLVPLVAVAAELGLADLVADGPRTVAELAQRSGSLPDPLYRVLRGLAAAGIFQETASRTFAATELSDTLRSGADSVRALARLWGISERTSALGHLGDTVRTGTPAFESVTGTDWWSHLANHPEQAAVFNDAMGYQVRRVHDATVSGYDLSGVRRLVDVGGGRGYLAAALLRRYPELTAVIFDQRAVVGEAERVLDEAGVADRAELVGGDFFDAVPEGGDVYVLSRILHDWDDERAGLILRNIRKAMAPQGRVLVVDAALTEGNHPDDGKVMDIVMLALHPGRERTLAEFGALFATAGLHHADTLALHGAASIVVGVPV